MKLRTFTGEQAQPVCPSLPAMEREECVDVEKVFLHLTQWVVPHGHEREHYHDLLTGLGFDADARGNYFARRGKGSETAFMAHLDCAAREVAPIRRVLEDGVVSTDGATILGADDRAGVAILLYLWAKKVPGLYCLFVGEEVGCIGSNAATVDYLWSGYRRAVSFDRRGYSSVVTHQCGRRTASDSFAAALSDELNAGGFNFAPDDTGVYTDSEVFAGLIPECTNVSVGYEGAHTNREVQDLTFLARLAEQCAQVDWEGLPVDRDPSENEWEGYAYEEEFGEPADIADPVGMALACFEYGITPDESTLAELAEGGTEALRRLFRGLQGKGI